MDLLIFGALKEISRSLNLIKLILRDGFQQWTI